MKYISKDRLAIYEHHLKVKSSEAIAAYNWNKALCGALFPALQCLEVTLRNSLSCAIQENPPNGAKGHYNTGADWIFSLTRFMGNRKLKNHERYTKNKRGNQITDSYGYVLTRNGDRLINKRIWEERKVNAASQKLNKEGKIASPDAIISIMDFGFWTNFLSNQYEDKNAQMLLWPNQLKTVFPNAPQGTTRENIEKKFSRIRELRNRLTHHEAIWKFFSDHPNTGKPDYSKPVYGSNASCSLLLKHYEDILELIGWMSTDRLISFRQYGGDIRFRSLCSQEGLHSFISPERLTSVLSIDNDKWGIKKLLDKLEDSETIRIEEKGKTVHIISNDFNRKVNSR